MLNLVKKVTIILLVMCFFANALPVCATLKSGIEYKLPIDYTKLNEVELEEKANFYYNLAIKNDNTKELTTEMTNALVLYTILTRKFPDNTSYFTKLGSLYDLCNQDIFAKTNFNRAISEDSSRAETYFYYGEFFYRRDALKKALNMYKKAYQKGFDNDYTTVFKIGDIYAKIGDTDAALKYFNIANKILPSAELENKIFETEQINQVNRVYYSDTRILEVER